MLSPFSSAVLSLPSLPLPLKGEIPHSLPVLTFSWSMEGSHFQVADWYEPRVPSLSPHSFHSYVYCRAEQNRRKKSLSSPTVQACGGIALVRSVVQSQSVRTHSTPRSFVRTVHTVHLYVCVSYVRLTPLQIRAA